MLKRDILMDQVSLLGQVIRKILAKLLGLPDVNLETSLQEIEVSLKEQADFDLQTMLQLEEPVFINALTEEWKLTAEDLEKLAEVIATLGRLKSSKNIAPPEVSLLYLQKSHGIYKYLVSQSSTFSLEWPNKMKSLELEMTKLLDREKNI